MGAIELIAPTMSILEVEQAAVRRDQILEYLKKHGTLATPAFYKALPISRTVIRNDLNFLHQRGIIDMRRGDARVGETSNAYYWSAR